MEFKNQQPTIHAQMENFLKGLKLKHEVSGVLPFAFSSKALRRRLLQKFIGEHYSQMMTQFKGQKSPHFRLTLDHDQITLKPSAESVIETSPWLAVKNVYKMFQFAGYILIGLVKALTQKRTYYSPLTTYSLVSNINYEIFIPHQDKISEMVEYFKYGPISILKEENQVYLIKSTLNKDLRPYHLSSNPYLKIFQDHRLSRLDLVFTIMRTLKNMLMFMILTLKDHNLSFLFKDIAFLAAVEMLDKKKLIKNFIFTNSEYTTQELWLQELPAQQKSFTTHMIWYSANSIGLEYKLGPKFFEYPGMRLNAIEEHWVWNQENLEWIRDLLKPKKIHNIGPMMWYLDKSVKTSRVKDKPFTVLVFDVPPLSDVHIQKNYSDLIYYYYSESNVTKFIQDIVDIMDNLKVPCIIKLKTKREVSKSHSVKYFENINQLSHEGKIKLLSPHTDLFREISDSDVCISIPYTSPGYIAEALKIPSFFYDPMDIIDFSKRSLVSESVCLQSKDELQKALGVISGRGN